MAPGVDSVNYAPPAKTFIEHRQYLIIECKWKNSCSFTLTDKLPICLRAAWKPHLNHSHHPPSSVTVCQEIIIYILGLSGIRHTDLRLDVEVFIYAKSHTTIRTNSVVYAGLTQLLGWITKYWHALVFFVITYFQNICSKNLKTFDFTFFRGPTRGVLPFSDK